MVTIEGCQSAGNTSGDSTCQRDGNTSSDLEVVHVRDSKQFIHSDRLAQQLGGAVVPVLPSQPPCLSTRPDIDAIVPVLWFPCHPGPHMSPSVTCTDHAPGGCIQAMAM